MEGNKSYLMYLFVFIFIALIVVFYVIPNNNEKVLSCTLLTNETGIISTYKVDSVYKHNKFQEVSLSMEFNLSKNWNEKKDYVYSLNQDSKEYTSLGFDFKLEEDVKNKLVIANIYGDKDMLNKNLIYFNNINDVKDHFESMEYECKIGGLE